MNSIIDFITENDVIIMASLLLLIVVLTIIVLITDSINRKKNSKDALKLFVDSNAELTDAFKEKIDDSDNLEYTTDLKQYDSVLNIDDNNNVSKIKYVEDDDELEKTKAQLELKALKEELIKAEQKEKTVENPKEESSLEIIDLNDISSKVEKYESDQEQNAIISIEEFNKVSDKIYEQNDEIQYTDEGNEPISIKELEKLYNTKELKAISSYEVSGNNNNFNDKDSINAQKDLSTKFKSTPIISPVYGLDTNNNSFDLENTGNYDRLSEEIRKTNEFLNTLRELQKNLQ